MDMMHEDAMSLIELTVLLNSSISDHQDREVWPQPGMDICSVRGCPNETGLCIFKDEISICEDCLNRLSKMTEIFWEEEDP